MTFWPFAPRDSDHEGHDQWLDEQATGEDIFDAEYIRPFKPVYRPRRDES